MAISTSKVVAAASMSMPSVRAPVSLISKHDSMILIFLYAVQALKFTSDCLSRSPPPSPILPKRLPAECKREPPSSLSSFASTQLTVREALKRRREPRSSSFSSSTMSAPRSKSLRTPNHMPLLTVWPMLWLKLDSKKMSSKIIPLKTRRMRIQILKI